MNTLSNNSSSIRSSNSSSNSSIDTLLITDKKTHIHKNMVRIIEKKIQHKVDLDEHDMEYIQNHNHPFDRPTIDTPK